MTPSFGGETLIPGAAGVQMVGKVLPRTKANPRHFEAPEPVRKLVASALLLFMRFADGCQEVL